MCRLEHLTWIALLSCVTALGCSDNSSTKTVTRPRPTTLATSKVRQPNIAAESSTPKHTQPKPAGLIPAFQTVDRTSGFDFQRYEDFRGQHRILEVNGGGVALFDYDLDGSIDLYMTNGCRLPLSLHDKTTRGEFFRNLGALRLENVSSQTGLIQHGQQHGCTVADFDQDGFDDLYLTAYGGNSFWHNQGDGTFANRTAATGTLVGKWSSSGAAADLNGDGQLDLYVTNYLDESDEHPKLCPNASSPDKYEQCSPANFDGVDDVLFIADGQGGFVDATAAAGMSGLRGKGLGVVIGDLDGDRRAEIYVANDGQANFLFQQREAPSEESIDSPDRPRIPKFEERGMASSVALSESGFAQASMGIAAGDYDGNGTVDLFVTNFYGDTNTLYANRGGLLFEDLTRASKLAASSRQTLGWGTIFLDVDNDGWLDLVVANGHIDDRSWTKYPEPYRMRPHLYRNERNGTFVEVTELSGSYFTTEWLARGIATGDLDRDGLVDLVVSHQLDPSAALRNETATPHASVDLKLVGVSSNRTGIGAVVEVVSATTNRFHQLLGGASFQSASSNEVHLGLENQTSVTITVQWPSGAVDTHEGLSPGVWTVIEQGSAVKTQGRP